MLLLAFEIISIVAAFTELHVAWAAGTGGLRGPDMLGPTWGPGTECRRRLRRLQGAQGVEAVLPLDLQGDWVSNRCETRPGPSFLTRRYKFHQDSMTFTFYQFFYADNQCQTPAYSYRIRGRLALADPSWSLPGATEAQYDIERVTLTVYHPDFAYSLSRQMNGTCPDVLNPREPLEIFRKYVVMETTREIDHHLDCTRGLLFTLHELQLLRQERHETRNERTGAVLRSEWLYLGDIHTETARRIDHRPKTYQAPLRKYNDESQVHCAICQIVYNSKEHKPPVLPRRQLDNVVLRGGWVSVSCEARSVFFLTRHLTFFDNQTWEGHYHYYKDPLCQTPTYTVSVKGERSAGSRSLIVGGATDFRFTTLAMYLTPQSDREVDRFNSKDSGCGRRGSWKLGRTLDVTSVGGCDVIGIHIPHTEFELLKMEGDPEEGVLLYNGQRPSSGQYPTTESLRPTSFQSPLVHCFGQNPLDARYTESGSDTNLNSGGHARTVMSNMTSVSIILITISLTRIWQYL